MTSSKNLFFRLPILITLLSVCYCNTSTAQQIQCPPNIGFEDGNLNNWYFYTGTCCPTNVTTLSGPVTNRHTLVTGTGVDPYGGFPVVAPGGGSFSLKLGNDINGRQAERARYYVRVPVGSNNIYTLIYRYAVVFQDPQHAPADQPRFEVIVSDSATGAPLPCNQFTFVANGTLPGFKVSPVNSGVLYKDWSTSSIDLSGLGGTTVAVDFITGDCDLGGHFGYGYLDVSCSFFQSYALYCPNATSVTLSAPPGFETYEWWDANFINKLGTTEQITIPTPTVTSKYAVILQPYVGFGCPDTLFTDFIISTMTIDVTGDTAVCRGDSVQLTSKTNSTSLPITYSWTQPAGLGCTNCDNPMASPASTRTYYATITDRDGCTAMDSVRVRVDEHVIADIQVADTFCAYETVPIKNVGVNPSGTDYTWDLSKDDGRLTSGFGNASINAEWYVPGTKRINVKVVNGRCRADDSTTTYIKESPLANFEIDDDACMHKAVLLRPVQQNATYHWTIDEQTLNDTSFNPVYYFTWHTEGHKIIKLTTRNINGCATTAIDSIEIHDYPEARITGSLKDICYGKEFELSTPEGKRFTYSWQPAQYFRGNNKSTVTGVAEQSGYIYLDVSNTWGCHTLDSVFISAAPCCDVFTADAFTPNNDGVNDYYSLPDMYKHQLVKFMIVNRRGQVVYETNTLDQGWDGSFKGKPAGQDTYNYYIRYICNQNEEKEKKGTFILMR